jgi:type IV pilus assembly protein PilA
VFSYPPQGAPQGSTRDTDRAPSLLRERLSQTNGYSLIELLVVILIIGVLAGIAIPSFLNQKSKAQDAQAKELARTAETTAETIATGNSGSYESVKTAELNAVEPTIRITPTNTEAFVSRVTSSRAEYALTTKATDGDELTISRNAGGEITRTCLSPVTKTGCSGAEKSSW